MVGGTLLSRFPATPTRRGLRQFQRIDARHARAAADAAAALAFTVTGYYVFALPSNFAVWKPAGFTDESGMPEVNMVGPAYIGSAARTRRRSTGLSTPRSVPARSSRRRPAMGNHVLADPDAIYTLGYSYKVLLADATSDNYLPAARCFRNCTSPRVCLDREHYNGGRGSRYAEFMDN